MTASLGLSRAVPLLLALVLAACGGAQPAGSGSPVASSFPELDQLVAAAKREGALAVAGPQGAEVQQALSTAFTDRYGIKVDYLGVGGPELPPRVQRERGGGVYQWDTFIVGTTTLLQGLKPMGALDPIEPELVLPEVRDPSSWRGGAVPFSDKDHT
ncbi:MAG TPA: hypothetical protein VKU60_09705, partial [Chloroflexota bacterium]|nr:hypothetical protein [Chloroflexota bacterium]